MGMFLLNKFLSLSLLTVFIRCHWIITMTCAVRAAAPHSMSEFFKEDSRNEVEEGREDPIFADFLFFILLLASVTNYSPLVL